jgi:hypothetical protein
MAPGEDVERGRASSAAERQKSIVSMTEFEGMDEYTALQKYILFYRDPRSAGHAQEEAPKKKKWWQSGGGKAAGGADLAAEVPDDCKFLPKYAIARPAHQSATTNIVQQTASVPASIARFVGRFPLRQRRWRSAQLSTAGRELPSLSLELAAAVVGPHHVRTVWCDS